MTPHAEDAYGAVPRAIEIGCCAQCNLFWFDESGSISLTPRAVLDLFQYIGRAGRAQNTQAANFACPRCGGRLELTHDLQRTTHFTYWRCPDDHGQLITFNQFLVQKNFIRAPSADELAKLRAMVRQINCSQCGAPIDLATDSACPHCGAPVSLIDSDAVARALHDFTANVPGTAAAGPEGTRATLSDAQLNALFDLERMRKHEGDQDLLAVGAAAIGGLISAWFRSDS